MTGKRTTIAASGQPVGKRRPGSHRFPAGSRALGGDELKRYEAGRMCEHTGCITPLSTYNPNTTCYVHELWLA